LNRFFYILLLFFCHSFYGQDPYAINYTIKDGLPTNTIYSTFQDDKGFIWFASDVGVIKYNSNNFTLYNTDNGLTDNEVFIIKKDFKGRKWFLTLNGIPCFIKNDQVFNDKNSTLIQQIKSKSMFVDFYEDELKNIYLFSRKGEINRIDENDSVTQIKSLDVITSGGWKKEGNLFVLNRLGVYDPINKNIDEVFESRFSSRVYHNKENTYYSKFNKLYQVFSKNSIEKIAELPEAIDIINIYKESVTKTWVCTRKGLFLLKDKKVEKHYFKTKIVTSISKDIEGNYWVSTLNNGLYLVPSFNVFQKNIIINTIASKNNNEIWFGGFKNDFYIKKNNSFIKNELNKNYRKDVISNIRFLKNVTYVLGKAGLQKRTLKNKIDIPFSINDLLKKEDDYFLGTTYTSKISEKDLFEHNYNKINQKRILDRRTKVLEKDSNSVYIGTNIGLYTYNSDSKLIFLGDSFSELKSSINSLFFDSENNFLLAGTSSKGIIVLENQKIKFIISKKDGLNNNTVTSLIKMNENQYLIGTNQGINLLTISGNSFKINNYNAALGFKNQKINAISNASDTTYIATNNGLFYFHQDYLKQKKSRPVIYVDNVFTNNIEIKNEDQNKIEYDKNDIKIKFTGISYLDEGNLSYYYQLNNNGWKKTKETSVNYESLSSNSYTFSVYAMNGFKESSEVKTIDFIIEKPFWKSWWFLSLFFLLSMFVIYYFSMLRVKYVHKQFIKEKKTILLEKENIALENQMLALEQKALRLQMNPHFIFNALNTIKGYYSEGNIQEASNYISNFSKLLRLLLENVEQYISLSLEVEMLDLYLQLTQVRYQNKFNYIINIDKDLNASETGIPTLLMQPIIENAIIHGVSPKTSKGNITVSFCKKIDVLICKVIDDGIGREASQKNKRVKHAPKAIKITKERLELIELQEKKKCNLEFMDLVNEEKSMGTKVVITIPLIKIW
jgi:sensor histidine kinase YesM